MLICASEHDEIDRDGALDLVTVEKLLKIKRDHEDWIRRVTGLGRSRDTVVLRMVGQVRGRAVELTQQTAADAILRSDDRYPAFPLTFEQQGLEIDLRHVAGEVDIKEQYWSAATAIIDEVVDQRLRDGVRKDKVEHLSVFAFARLPLLVYLGTKLDDTYAVEIYQRHRSTQRWDWPDGTPAVSFVTELPAVAAEPEAVLILNISGTIQPAELPADLVGLPTYRLHPDGVTPAPDVISSRDSLKSFEDTIRALLSTLEATHKELRRLHVFGALPISAGVALGRVRDHSVHPVFTMYDRGSDGYRPVLEIK